jgi:hypothetical protein
MKRTILQQLGLNNFWALNKTLCRAIGIEEILLLQHFIDLQFNLFGGKEFFQQQDRMGEELGISVRMIKTHISKLINLNLITCVKKGVPAKNYYFVLEDEVINLINNPSTKEEKIVSKVVKKEEVIDITPSIVKPSTIKEKVSKKPTNRMEFSNDFNDLLNSIDETDLEDYKFSDPKPKIKGGLLRI